MFVPLNTKDVLWMFWQMFLDKYIRRRPEVRR
jgi:hypothetical protein